ncbi:MAG: hypothetical protein R3302_00865 [Sulfurimonadaceae bacterium]|nr:hypothetical protein [Sulfurimonadaceae bacterium]
MEMMDPQQEYNDIFVRKFAEMGIGFMIDEAPVSEAFEEYAGDLMSSWVAYAVMHEDPNAFMMMLNHISKMRRLGIFGHVAMAIAGQGYNAYGDQIPPELDAIMGVVNAQPSLELIVETFNTIGHTQAAYIEGEIIRFK